MSKGKTVSNVIPLPRASRGKKIVAKNQNHEESWLQKHGWSIAIQLIAVAFAFGVMQQRVSALEDTVKAHAAKFENGQGLTVDVAVMKTQLSTISTTLSEIKVELKSGKK